MARWYTLCPYRNIFGPATHHTRKHYTARANQPTATLRGFCDIILAWYSVFRLTLYNHEPSPDYGLKRAEADFDDQGHGPNDRVLLSLTVLDHSSS